MGLQGLPSAPDSAGGSLPGIGFESSMGLPVLGPPKIETEVIWEDLRKPVTELELTAERETQLVNDVLAAIQAAEDARRERIKTVQKVRDRRRLSTPDRTPPFPEGANWHVPFMRWVLDGLEARLWGNTFGTPPFVMVSGVQGAEDTGQAARTEPFLQFVNAEELKVDTRYDEVIQRVLTDGFVMLKCPWRRDVQKRKRRRMVRQYVEVTDPETNLPLLDEQNRPTIRVRTVYDVEEVEEEVYHGPAAELVTIDNFVVPNPNISDVNKQPWVAQQFWLTREQLWRERRRTATLDGQEQPVGMYDHVEDLVMLQRREDTSAQGMEHAAAAREGVSQEITTPDLVGEIRCYEVIWPYRSWLMAREENVANPDELPERVILTIAVEDVKLIRKIHYPFWDPYPESYWVKVFVISEEGRWNNQSVGEVLMPVQDELDTIHWQRTDATTIMILAFLTFLAEEGAADQLEKLKLGQRNVVESIDGVKLMSDVIKVSLQAPGLDIEQLVLKFGELLSAMAAPQLGSPSAGDKTAFEIGTVVREGNLKFTKMIARLGESIIQLDNIVLRRYAQYYPLVAPKLFRIKGAEPDVVQELALGDLNFQYDLKLRGQTVAANREIEAAKAFRVLQLSEQSMWLRMLLLGNPQGVYELVRTFLHQIDWPGGVEVLIGKKQQATAVLTQVLSALAGASGMAPPQVNAQGNGGEGANLAALRPIAQLLNDSGLARELAASGVQSTSAGATETAS